MPLTQTDLDDLRFAKSLLENPGLAARITGVIGKPLEKGFELLPERWSNQINEAAQAALNKALTVAVATLDDRGPKPADNLLHKILVTATGVGGGVFGLPALPVELPISTTIMLRSIVDIARSEGERIKSIESKLACIEVFALGGRAKSDDAAPTGYFAVRAAMARAMSEAAEYIAERGIVQEGAPAIVRLIGQVASRFGVTVSEKLAVQAAPVIGAIGGGVVNLLFIDHFQDMARGHFIVRRLERAYGADEVQNAYISLPT
ncbi:MAG TPA: EcsC family protein [Tepidisphaeraceae bacterium]|nr:EcsC family protein [Tepidisphaeraceae bacterium]